MAKMDYEKARRIERGRCADTPEDDLWRRRKSEEKELERWKARMAALAEAKSAAETKALSKTNIAPDTKRTPPKVRKRAKPKKAKRSNTSRWKRCRVGLWQREVEIFKAGDAR